MDNQLERVLLDLVLADSSQDFFVQKSMALKGFKIFSELPLEIRLQIWRNCFPDPQVVEFFDHLTSNEAAIPITLHVNQESRYETLKHYIVLHGRPIKTVMKSKPLYLAPSWDSVLVNADIFLTRPSIYFYLRSLSQYSQPHQTGIKLRYVTLRKLEIVNIIWIDMTPSQLFNYLQLFGFFTTKFMSLPFFHGLKEVHFSICHPWDRIPQEKEYFESFKEEVRKFFEEVKADFPLCLIPEIFVWWGGEMDFTKRSVRLL